MSEPPVVAQVLSAVGGFMGVLALVRAYTRSTRFQFKSQVDMPGAHFEMWLGSGTDCEKAYPVDSAPKESVVVVVKPC